MDIKKEFLKEKEELLDVKKPYETAAFVIFAVFFLQQMFYLVINLLDFIQRISDRNNIVAQGGTTYKVNFSYNSKAITTNIPAFVSRVLSVDPSKGFWIFMSFLFLGLWYLLVYLLIWNYCKKHGHPKWTWTALIVFGPTSILFVPTYLLYVIYVFRSYIFRFIRRGIEEFRKYDSSYQFDEEKAPEKPKKVLEEMEME